MTRQPKFELGKVVITPGIQGITDRFNFNPHEILERHLAMDCSDMDAIDQQANAHALKDGGRIFSKFIFIPNLQVSIDVFVITEACGDDGKRESTCILLPTEY